MRKKKNSEQKVKKERLTKEKFVEIGFHIWRQFDDPYYAGFAAQIAYFFFMASIPTLVVLTQFLGLFDISLDFIKTWLENHTNANINGIVLAFLSASSVKITNIVMVVLILWAASSLEFSLARLTSYILTEGRYRFNFFTERVKAIPTAIFSIVAIAFTLIIVVYGDGLINTFASKLDFPRALLVFRIPLAAGLFFVMLLVNYYFLPRIRVPLKCVVPGAIIASVGIMIVSGIYAIYIGFIASYNILYGSFANIIVLMLWFYLIAWVLCIGMMFNKAWDDVMQRNCLSKEKILMYLDKQLGDDAKYDYKKFIILDEDKDEYDTLTLAEKASLRFLGEDPKKKNYSKETENPEKYEKKERKWRK